MNRFEQLKFSPMGIHDNLKGDNIHLGSQYEARELCELLNELVIAKEVNEAELCTLRSTVKNQSLTLLRTTADLTSANSEVIRLHKLAEINKFQL